MAINIITVTGIYSENLYYPLENHTLELGVKTGSSNHVAQDGLVSISHEEGNLLLIESWE
jgi:thiamine pyrophosphokinase